MIKTTLTCVVLTFMASTAMAATVTFITTPEGATRNPVATDWSGAFADNVTSSVGGVRRSPWEDADLGDTGLYSSITGWVAYDFDGLQDSLSFVWGSPDTYNWIDFYLDDKKVDTFQLSNVNGVNFSDPWAIFGEIKGGVFDRVVLNSSSPAFEYANLETSPAPVPVPAPGLLLAAGLGTLGLRRRRSRR